MGAELRKSTRRQVSQAALMIRHDGSIIGQCKMLDVSAGGGGRVTELAARPLLNAHFPQLAGVVQPLAGEYAARRTLLEALPFAAGYGVETGLLIDTFRARGLDAVAQVDLGQRTHGHQDTAALGRMAATIVHTVNARVSPGPGGYHGTEPP